MSIHRTLGRLAAVMFTAGLLMSAAQAQTIAYITNGNTNEGWTLINGGAKDAAKKAGVKFIEAGGRKGRAVQAAGDRGRHDHPQGQRHRHRPGRQRRHRPRDQQGHGRRHPRGGGRQCITGAKITSYVATDNIKAANVQGSWAADQVVDGDTVIYVTGDQGQSTAASAATASCRV